MKHVTVPSRPFLLARSLSLPFVVKNVVRRLRPQNACEDDARPGLRPDTGIKCPRILNDAEPEILPPMDQVPFL